MTHTALQSVNAKRIRKCDCHIMAYAVYTIRAMARDLVREATSKLLLSKNYSGQYNHDNISTLQKGISWVLSTQENPGLDTGDNTGDEGSN